MQSNTMQANTMQGPSAEQTSEQESKQASTQKRPRSEDTEEDPTDGSNNRPVKRQRTMTYEEWLNALTTRDPAFSPTWKDSNMKLAQQSLEDHPSLTPWSNEYHFRFLFMDLASIPDMILWLNERYERYRIPKEWTIDWIENMAQVAHADIGSPNLNIHHILILDRWMRDQLDGKEEVFYERADAPEHTIIWLYLCAFGGRAPLRDYGLVPPFLDEDQRSAILLRRLLPGSRLFSVILHRCGQTLQSSNHRALFDLQSHIESRICEGYGRETKKGENAHVEQLRCLYEHGRKWFSLPTDDLDAMRKQLLHKYRSLEFAPFLARLSRESECIRSIANKEALCLPLSGFRNTHEHSCKTSSLSAFCSWVDFFVRSLDTKNNLNASRDESKRGVGCWDVYMAFIEENVHPSMFLFKVLFHYPLETLQQLPWNKLFSARINWSDYFELKDTTIEKMEMYNDKCFQLLKIESPQPYNGDDWIFYLETLHPDVLQTLFTHIPILNDQWKSRRKLFLDALEVTGLAQDLYPLVLSFEFGFPFRS